MHAWNTQTKAWCKEHNPIPIKLSAKRDKGFTLYGCLYKVKGNIDHHLEIRKSTNRWDFTEYLINLKNVMKTREKVILIMDNHSA